MTLAELGRKRTIKSLAKQLVWLRNEIASCEARIELLQIQMKREKLNKTKPDHEA